MRRDQIVKQGPAKLQTAPLRSAINPVASASRPELAGNQRLETVSLLPVADVAEALSPESERELVQRAQAGNEEAFGQLMRLHYEQTFRLIQSILRDEHAARDVGQEVWLTVWKNLAKFRGDAKFSTWVHPIAVRRAIDHLRSRQRWLGRFIPFLSEQDDGETTGVPEPAAAGDPRQDLEKAERNDRFERAIASLPPKHRAVLALREIQGLSYDEIAKTLDCRRGTVMSRLFHARRLLAQKIGELPCE
jgi:RNA polymerase sigma-70 factor (ECF subfamily)